MNVPSPETAPESPADPAHEPIRSRRDALPLWVIILLVFFIVLRVAGMTSESRGAKPGVQRTGGGADKNVDTDSMQELIVADSQAKTAYAVSLGKVGPVVQPDTVSLQTALKAAEQLEEETDNSPSAARRVIILRALLERTPPLAVSKKGIDPLAAFTTALPAETPPVDRDHYAAEARLWQAAYGKEQLTPHQLDALAAQIRILPNIRWWQWPALSSLYQRQGDLSEANRYALMARSRAVLPLAAASALLLGRIALGVAGVLLLIYFSMRAVGVFRATESSPGMNLWPTLPERKPFSERQLGAGDLMAVFVLFLAAREVLSLLLVGFPGIGPRHFLAAPGLITPFQGIIKAMPAVWRSELLDVLTAVHYLLSAVPPFVYLRFLARRRGASLADELGWSRRFLWPNIGYGIAGYALATPLFLLAALLAPRLFRHAPAPPNPVIPQIIGTSDFWAAALLIGLTSFAAPLVEELLFRGVLYQAIKLRVGVWPAIILSSLTFGFIHPVGIAEMLALAVLGGVFAWMAETRKSLVPSITAHFLNNFTATLLLMSVLSG